jgi:putative colanic acid biosysnthesis UDP-glucose lipid carrier transferase
VLTETNLQHRVHGALGIGVIDLDGAASEEDLEFARRSSLAGKRAFDIVMASLLLFAVAPLLLFCMLAIRLTSRGPALFRQQRSGLHGHPFTIFKLRTMRVTEDDGDVKQAQRHDPRVTPIGAFLRRTSIDELPQLLNVLRGEMSLVGPRPHAVAHDRHYALRIDRYYQRLAVKPGITGLAQVRNLRGECLSLDHMVARVDIDREYARNASLRQDVVILLQTIPHMLLSDRAY